MIVREWRGRADLERGDAYPTHFRSRVISELRHIPGSLDADLLRRDLGDGIEFTILTRWASMEAMRAFAGSDPTRAVVEPGAAAALHDFDEHVTRHEVVERIALGAG